VVINIKEISFIKKIYPPLFDWIDTYNGCIIDDSGERSVSIWYVIYLLVYIIIFLSIIIYIYINIENIFDTLGDGVKVFIIMFIFLYILLNRVYFYDLCFEKKNKKDCENPSCPKLEKPLWSFDKQKCVSKSPEPIPDPGIYTHSKKECNEIFEQDKCDRKKKCTWCDNNSKCIENLDRMDKDELCNKSISEDEGSLNTQIVKTTFVGTEAFALLEKSDDINFKKKNKNSGHESYKSATLMDNLESYLLNMI